MSHECFTFLPRIYYFDLVQIPHLQEKIPIRALNTGSLSRSFARNAGASQCVVGSTRPGKYIFLCACAPRQVHLFYVHERWRLTMCSREYGPRQVHLFMRMRAQASTSFLCACAPTKDVGPPRVIGQPQLTTAPLLCG